jgi:hypothetical protein
MSESVLDNPLLGAPLRAASTTMAEYDRDPTLWPNVRQWKTEVQITKEIAEIGKKLKLHPTNQTKRFQILRNKRKLLFAKKILISDNLAPAVKFGLVLARNMFGLKELHMPGDPPYDKRRSVTFLMELSKFLYTCSPNPDYTLQH